MKKINTYVFDQKKDAFLRKTRSVGFDNIIQRIDDGGLLDILRHTNTTKYPDQFIAVVELQWVRLPNAF